MGVGDRYLSDGLELEVIWDGGEGLTADVQTKPSEIWTPPKRIYNKKSDYWTKPRKKRAQFDAFGHPLDNPETASENPDPQIENPLETD